VIGVGRRTDATTAEVQPGDSLKQSVLDWLSPGSG
jgi:hypothetical protein